MKVAISSPTFSLSTNRLSLGVVCGPCHTLLGSENGYRPVETQIGTMYHELKTLIPFDPVILLLGICPKKLIPNTFSFFFFKSALQKDVSYSFIYICKKLKLI